MRPSRAGSSPTSASSFLIRSCILLFYLSALPALSFADGADALYANRADLASARKAADLWRAELAAHPGNFEAAWKLARAEYWLGGHTPESEARRHFEAGIEAGQRAVALDANRPDGYFWTAANMGTMAESFGIRAGLKYRKPIKEALERVLQIDPSFREGSADRALGRWYAKVPRLFGGNAKLAEEHLQKALAYNPASTITNYFLAELYVDEGRTADARVALKKVIDAPIDPEYAPEDRDWKDKASKMLATMK